MLKNKDRFVNNKYNRLLYVLILICGAFESHAQIITTYAGNGVNGISGNGNQATTARVQSPSSMAVDGAGNLYLNDKNSVRKVSRSGIITTIAGTTAFGYNGDGIPATNAFLYGNWGVAVDGPGNVYITDQSNFRVRKVNTAGIISTIAGTGTAGTSGDNGPASVAKLNGPLGIAADGAGNVYIGDPTDYCVRKIGPGNIITTVAGNHVRGYSGDGYAATTAEFGYIWGLATDNIGNLYIADAEFSCIRKVNSAGIISTFAGGNSAGFSGDGGPAVAAKLDFPTGVSADALGNVYIADCHNNRVRKVDNNGIITTVAGTGASGFYGDYGPATAAKLYHPASVVSAKDKLFISDFDNSRIRVIRKVLSFDGGGQQSLVLCENNAAAPINTLLTVIDYLPGRTDNWNLIYGPFFGSVSASYSALANADKVTPTGLYYTPVTGFVGNDTFRVVVNNGIVSDTTMICVTVNPLSITAGTIMGDSSVCKGSTITLTDAVWGGNWSSSDPSAIVSPVSGGCIVTGISPGTSIVQYSISNSCGVSSASKTITVRPLPAAGTIIGASAVCIGSSTTMSDSEPNGTWSSSSNNATVINGVVKARIAGLDTIFYGVSNGYCTATAMHPLVIDNYPRADSIYGPNRVCVGSTITLIDVMPDGTWNSDDAIFSHINGMVTGITTGSGTLSYSVVNSCGSDNAIKQLTVDPLPMPPQIIQYGYVLSVPNIFSAYQWTRNGMAILGSDTNTCFVTNSGNYAVVVTNAFGCSAPTTAIYCDDCSTDDIKIFPNPVSSALSIEWCKAVVTRILAADGREIRKIENKGQIDIGDLPDGVYLIVLYDMKGNKIKTKRITKLTQ